MKKNNDFEIWEIFMRDEWNSVVKTTTSKIVDYCRYMQKEFVEGDGDVSGVEVLAGMLQQGTITLRLYTAMLPAVQYYDVDYTLTINLDNEGQEE